MWRASSHDHEERIHRTRLSLDGLSVGECLGRCLTPLVGPNHPQDEAETEELIQARITPLGPWRWGAASAMASAVAETLSRHGEIQPEDLAARLAAQYVADPGRDYSTTAQELFRNLSVGQSWRTLTARQHSGQGSLGSGASVRSAPIGAYFADDYEAAASQARLAAEVTHAHPDGQAGAVAVAVAAAWCWRVGLGLEPRDGVRLLVTVLDFTPDGPVREGLAKALMIPEDLSIWSAVGWLGNGGRRSAADTVPFCLWCTAGRLDDYRDALWATVSGAGDRRTNAAIVGGLMALVGGRDGLPEDWLASRESLPIRW